MVRVGPWTRLSCMQAGIKCVLFLFCVWLSLLLCVSNWLRVVFWNGRAFSLPVYISNMLSTCCTILWGICFLYNHNCLCWVSQGVFSTSTGFCFIDIAFFSGCPCSSSLMHICFFRDKCTLPYSPKEFQWCFLNLKTFALALMLII